jgi:5-methylcytosine-specific restriction endonuclease McrA
MARAKDGLHAYCRECSNAKSAAHRKSNLEQYRERGQKHARKNASVRKEYFKVWRQQNSEHVRELNKAYREKNSDRMLEYRETHQERWKEYHRVHKQNHRKQYAIHQANRRAHKAQAKGSFTPQEWEALCSYYDYTCLRCGKREPEIKLTVDHVVPLSLGGANSIDNLQPLCSSCNTSKHTKTIDYREKFCRKSL